MPARIARIYRNVETLNDGSPNPTYLPDKPLFWMEYLQSDDGTLRLFSENIEMALIYPSHLAADAAATKLRAEAPELGFVFGQTCSQASLDHPAYSPPARPARARRERIEEEMRAKDLRELDRIVIEE